MEHNAKTSAELLSAVKNKIWISKWLNLEISILIQYFLYFLPNSILFQGLENRFHNSILVQYFQSQYRERALTIATRLIVEWNSNWSPSNAPPCLGKYNNCVSRTWSVHQYHIDDGVCPIKKPSHGISSSLMPCTGRGESFFKKREKRNRERKTKKEKDLGRHVQAAVLVNASLFPSR